MSDTNYSLGMDSYYEGLARYITTCPKTPLTITIEGDKGCGKTTALKEIEHRIHTLESKDEQNSKIEETSKNKRSASTNGLLSKGIYGLGALISNTVEDALRLLFWNCSEENKHPEKLYYPIWFHTWRYSTLGLDDNLALALLTHLNSELDTICEQAIENRHKESQKTIFSIFGRRILNGAGNINGIAGLISETVNTFDDFANVLNVQLVTEQMARLHKAIEKKIENYIPKGGRLIIFIDDLECLEPVRAVELLTGIQNLMNFENCVFVVALDKATIEAGLNTEHSKDTSQNEVEINKNSTEKTDAENDLSSLVHSNSQFWNKVNPVTYKLPTNRYDYEQYITDSITTILGTGTINDVKKYTTLSKNYIGPNLRDIQQILNTWQLKLFVYKEKFETLHPDLNYNLFALIVMEQKLTEEYIKLLTCFSEKGELNTEDLRVYSQSETNTEYRLFKLPDTTSEVEFDEQFNYILEDSMYSTHFTPKIFEAFTFSDELKLILKMIDSDLDLELKKDLNTNTCIFSTKNGNRVLTVYRTKGKDRIKLEQHDFEDFEQIIKNDIQKKDEKHHGYFDYENAYVILYVDQFIDHNDIKYLYSFVKRFMEHDGTYNPN